MLKLIWKNYNMNLLNNIFMLFQFILIFLVLNSKVSEIIQINSNKNYLSGYDDNTYYLSGAIKQNIDSFNDINGFWNIIDEIKSIDGISGVGYQLENQLVLDNNIGEIIDGIYLNDVMQKLKYKLAEGKWFKKNTNECEIIIGGKLCNKYDIGDIINIRENNNTTTNQLTPIFVQAKVIGKLKNPLFLMHLNVSASISTATFDALWSQFNQSNIILYNTKELIKNKNLIYPYESLIITIFDEKKDKTLKDVSQFGQAISFITIEKNSFKYENRNVKNTLITNIMLAIVIAFGVICSTYQYVYKSMKAFSIYYLFGMNHLAFLLMIFSLNIINVCGGVLLSALLYSISGTVRVNIFGHFTLGSWNVITSIIYIGILFLLTFIYSIFLSKRKPMELFRRFR